MKYSKEYLDDLIEIIQLLLELDTRLLAFKLMESFIIKHNITINPNRTQLIMTDTFELKLDLNLPYSLYFYIRGFVEGVSHLVFINDLKFDNRKSVRAVLNTILRLKKNLYGI